MIYARNLSLKNNNIYNKHFCLYLYILVTLSIRKQNLCSYIVKSASTLCNMNPISSLEEGKGIIFNKISLNSKRDESSLENLRILKKT